MNRFLSFLRQPPRPSRRATAAPPVEIAFDRWLDTQMPGPTPGLDEQPAPFRSDAQRAEFASLTETFRQVDRLDASAIDAETSAMRQAQCWEDIMKATISTAATVSPAFNPVLGPMSRRPTGSVPSRLRDQPSRIGGFARLSPVLNVTMAALLVIVLGFAAWSLAGTRLGGPGDGPGRTEVPAGMPSLAAQDLSATPTTISSPAVRGILPTADECTITPLTIDQVMDRIKHAGPQIQAQGGLASPPADAFAIATPPMLTHVPPTQADIDAIAAVQREFVACTIKGNLLQIWAFYEPTGGFWYNFLNFYPRFVDEKTARADIEAYVNGGVDRRLPGAGWDGVQAADGTPNPSGVPLVNPDPEASLIYMSQMTSAGRDAEITVSMLYYDLQHPESPPRYIPIDQMGTNWVYVWNNDAQTWMIRQIGSDVNRG